MTRPDDELAANRRSIVLKGRIRSKITALEKLYGKYRLTVMRRWKTLAGPIEAARTSLGLLIEIQPVRLDDIIGTGGSRLEMTDKGRQLE